jgi:MFS family permease
VLGGAAFRRLFATRLSSQCADGVFQASLAGAVLFNPERQADPAQVAAGFTVLLLPYSLVGPFAGVLLDRWSRQRVLVVANLVRCGLVALVAAEIAAGLGGLLFYVSALATISVNRFFLAALSAALPHVVTTAQLVTANSLSTTSGTVATTVGGGLAIVIRLFTGSDNHGYAVVALCSALPYAVSALAARGFAMDQLGPDDAEREQREGVLQVARGLVAGARHVRHRQPAAFALAAIGGHRFFYGVSTIATLLLYRNYFHDDGVFQAGLPGLGQVVGLSAAGALLASVVTPPATRRVGKPAWITWQLVLACVTQVVLGLPFRMQTLLPAALLLGFAAQGAKICVDTTVQETVNDDFRGRVFSLYDTLFNMAFVAAAVVAATVLPDTGRSYPVLVAIAAGYAAAAGLYAVATRRLARSAPAASAVSNES